MFLIEPTNIHIFYQVVPEEMNFLKKLKNGMQTFGRPNMLIKKDTSRRFYDAHKIIRPVK
ncbi:MAG: hypothetical protein A2W86_03030 [Bacteroidetes bacterium GWD2_45_23]|nr:MAG: hypothetical protein A2W87_08690 [Bacteroidetes bacterium GWC2_46_850]OFX81599.1 MAG: hypothetical protein A2071_04210 [Bacteroidetes bacterium GWC1_47_7]OFX84911.1 MAG: hypothetical protein A2W86_03030 [Bacteroidetes bacterium GWD2_45_23]HBB00229.1 hypothetical protein [Porphyromonadaceae bacterium]HCC17261.1 hypothetical protein [Porphyromonadaceae bacterium]